MKRSTSANVASEAVGSRADPMAAESSGHGAERCPGLSGPFEGSGPLERTSSPTAKRTTSHRKPLAPRQILWQRNPLVTAQRDPLAPVGRLRGQDPWNGLRPQWPLPCPGFRGPFEGSEPLERTSSHLWSGQSRLTSHRKPLAPEQILWQRNPLATAQRDALASVDRSRGQDPWN